MSDGAPSGFNTPSVSGGLLMRVTPAGVVTWAVRSVAGIKYTSVTTSPKGRIFVAGNMSRTAGLDWPGLLVGRHSERNGAAEAMMLIGENAGGVTGQNGYYLEAGLTPYDEANRIAWTQNGLIVSANTDLPGTTRAIRR